MTKTFTDAENIAYAKRIREREAEYAKKWSAKQRVLNRKIKAARIIVTEAEILAEMKKTGK